MAGDTSQLIAELAQAITDGDELPAGVVAALDGQHALLLRRRRQMPLQPAVTGSGYVAHILATLTQAHYAELVERGRDERRAYLAELVTVRIAGDFAQLQPDPAPQPQPTQPVVAVLSQPAQPEQRPQPADAFAGVVRVYPDIAAAALRAGVAPLYRVYLLARAADPAGRGVMTRDELHQATAGVIGKRRLRQVIADGRGVFWRTKGAHVGLYSPARIAWALGVDRLTGHSVALDVADLQGGIAQFRAALLAAFHGGRQDAAGNADPISRGKLAEICGIGGNSQRNYERTTGIISRANYAIGAELGTPEAQEQAYQHDTFVYTDWRGRFGDRGIKYVAWRLPNSYQAELPHMPKGRQRRINEQLTLFNVVGQTPDCVNSQPGLCPNQGSNCKLTRVFWHDGKQAHDGYLSASRTLQPDATRPVKLVGVGFWTLTPTVSG